MKPLRDFSPDLSRKTAIRFVILVGLVSLFADATYEGARSIAGSYLKFLGASAALVGFFAGLGELAGYGLRVLNSKGEVVAERYEPADMQRAISWTPPAPAAESDRIAELQQKIREEKIRQRREEIDRARGLPK